MSGSTGQLAFGIVGAVVGAFVGNPYLGFVVGSAIGGALFPGELPGISKEGPRLGDLRVSASSYGQPIPIAFGRVRIAGNRIWSTGIIETATVNKDEAGGKGAGPTQEVTATLYTYSASFAVSLCEGPIVGVRRIWANGQLIYNLGTLADYETYVTSLQDAISIRVYSGSDTQEADPLMEAAEGTVPAYRGLAYVVFDTLQLLQYGNAIPNLEFEVIVSGSNGSAVTTLDTNASTDWGAGLTANITPDGMLIAYVQVSAFVSKILLLNPFTLQVIREYFYAGVTNVSSFALPPRLNSNGDLCFYANGQLWLWLRDQAPTVIGYATQYSRIEVDDDGNFYVAQNNNALAPPNVYALIRIDALNGFVTKLRDLGTAQVPHDIFDSHDGYIWLTYEAVSGACVVEKLNRSTGAVVATVSTSLYSIGSIAVAGDGSVWFRTPVVSGNFRIGRISPDLSTFTVPWDTGSSGAGDTVTVINRDWSTGDILVAYGTDFRRFDEGGTQISSTVTNNAAGYHVATSPTYPDSIYAFNAGAALVGSPPHAVKVARRDALSVANPSLGSVLAALSQRCNYSADELDVTGIVDTLEGYVQSQRGSGKAALDPLLTAYTIDVVESDSKLRFYKRGTGSIVAIAESECGARAPTAEVIDPINETRMQEVELPHEVAINYLDSAADYQTGTQYARRLVSNSDNDKTLNLPVVMSASRTRQLAEMLLYETWAGRFRYEFSVTNKFVKYEPGDVVTLAGVGTVRLVSRKEGNGVIEFTALGYDQNVYTQVQTGAELPAPLAAILSVGPTNLALLEVPLLRSSDDDYGLYVAGSGYTNNWKGGKLFKSTDNVTYTDTGVFLPTGAGLGYALTALGDFAGGNRFDETNTVQISVLGGATLSSLGESAVLAGGNAAMLGDELIQYKGATLVSAGKYTLSGLLRGRMGTEYAMRRHVLGERFALLDADTVRRITLSSNDHGQQRYFKGVSIGSAVEQATPRTQRVRDNSLKPLSPVQVGGGRDSSNNVTCNWVRRARKAAGWNDFVDVPLDEPTESYEADFFGGTAVNLIAISRANNGVFTTSGAHGLSVGSEIYIDGAGGMTAVNDRPFTVDAVPTTTTFTVGEDTSGYSAYTSSGALRKRGRTVTASTTTCSYSAANQTTDFGGVANPVRVAVYQMSSRVGRGFPGVAVGGF